MGIYRSVMDYNWHQLRIDHGHYSKYRQWMEQDYKKVSNGIPIVSL